MNPNPFPFPKAPPLDNASELREVHFPNHRPNLTTFLLWILFILIFVALVMGVGIFTALVKG